MPLMPKDKMSRFDFPEGFVFGAATAAYQIEGSGFGGCGPSHWDSFAATPGNVVRAEDGSVACDDYHRWPADLNLRKQAKMDAYRFSTSWSRVMPDGRNVNPQVIDFYDKMVDGMLERGLKPFQTLYHWEMPSALADLGCWTNRDVACWFADFAEAVTHRLGDRVASIATINEPWCVAWLSHLMGIHAPGHRDIRAAARAMHHVLLADGSGVERLRGMGQKNLGIVLNFDHTDPATGAPGDSAAADLWDGIFNRWLIEGVTRKTYQDVVLAGLFSHMPKGWEKDIDLIGQPLDWLGVTYYTRHSVAAAFETPWPGLRDVTGTLPKTQMGWEIYPEGLEGFLTRMARDYVGDPPLYVTENGMANADVVEDGAISDGIREDYLFAHLAATTRAVAQGVNVKGFFYWSLLDNYEWSKGHDTRFGLVHVNIATQNRTLKTSCYALARAIARND